MSAQEVHSLAGPHVRQKAVSDIVLIYMAVAGWRQNVDLARALGWDETKVSRKLNAYTGKKGTTPWTLADLDALAIVFGCPVSDFLRDPEEVKASLKSRCSCAEPQVTTGSVLCTACGGVAVRLLPPARYPELPFPTPPPALAIVSAD